jgi:hypothetical protein
MATAVFFSGLCSLLLFFMPAGFPKAPVCGKGFMVKQLSHNFASPLQLQTLSLPDIKRCWVEMKYILERSSLVIGKLFS